MSATTNTTGPLDAKRATNFISTALKLWLLDTGNAAVPAQTRVTAQPLVATAPDLLFTIQGATALTAGWVRVWDGTRAWSANLLKDTYTGKAAPCARSAR